MVGEVGPCLCVQERVGASVSQTRVKRPGSLFKYGISGKLLGLHFQYDHGAVAGAATCS